MENDSFHPLKLTGVLFDLDGTLLNTLDDLAISANYALSECRYPSRTKEEIRLFVGNGVYQLIRRALPQEEPTKEEINECLDIFRSHYLVHMNDHTAPYDGILPMLQRLKEAGYTIGVISNKLEPAVRQLCEHFFPGLVDIAVGDLPPRPNKPSPDIVFAAMEAVGLSQESCVYVGDTNVDIETGRNAGLSVISCSWGFRDREHLIQAGATTIIEQPAELLKLLHLSGGFPPQ